jgi:hypothetical protein
MDTNQVPTQSQTGVPGTPVQVENVQYNVNAGKVKSKIGFAGHLTFLMAWAVGTIALFSVIGVRNIIAPTSPEEAEEWRGVLVLLLSFAIPVVPLFIFLIKRIKTLLIQNPAGNDDITYKKSIQVHLVLSLVNTVAWVGIASYNILAKLLLDEQIAAYQIVDGFFFALTAVVLSYFFWTYQKETKR